MIQFFYHDSIQQEITALEKRRFRTIRKGLSAFEKLCEKQFHPTEPQQVVAPARLHRITQNDLWALWKIELVIPNSGLRPNQWPRMWFVVKGATIIFLCISSHIDNYKDSDMDRIALSRVSDFF